MKSESVGLQLNFREWNVGCLVYLHREPAFLITFRQRVHIWGEKGCRWQRITRIIPQKVGFLLSFKKTRKIDNYIYIETIENMTTWFAPFLTSDLFTGCFFHWYSGTPLKS